MSVRFELRSQPVNATHALNLSAGVSYSNVFLGRSFSCLATRSSSACEWIDRSVPFGKYCLKSRLVFSFDPRCQGLLGSQKYTCMSVARVNRLWFDISDPLSQVSDLYSSLGRFLDCSISAWMTVSVFLLSTLANMTYRVCRSTRVAM